MFKILSTAVLVLLVATVALSYDSDRGVRAKDIEVVSSELNAPAANPGTWGSAAPLGTTGVPGWIIYHESATIDYLNARPLADGVAWVNGYRSASPRQNGFWLLRDYGASATFKNIDTVDGLPLASSERVILAARDTSLAVGATTTGRIIRTTDGGDTWTEVYNYGEFFDGVGFLGPDTVIAYGDYIDATGLWVARSTDAGATWTRLTNLPATAADNWYGYVSYHQAMDVLGSTAWITVYHASDDTKNPRIYKTTDGGETWTDIEVALTGGSATNYRLRAINFLTEDVGFAISETPDNVNYYYLHKTTDGGLTWSDTLRVDPGVPKGQEELYGVIPVRGTDNVIAVGQDFDAGTAKAWWSTDQGANWTSVDPLSGPRMTFGAFWSPTQGIGLGTKRVYLYRPQGAVKVTFTLNAATVPDTLPLTGQTVQIRGGVNHAGGMSPITWGDDPQNNLTQVGGDYWSKTFEMQVGDTLRYKYVINTASGVGWEQGVVPAVPGIGGGDRAFVVPAQDTVLDFEFWNNGPDTNPQFFRPWTPDPDTMYVHFRVSMLGPITLGTFGPFNNDTDTVGVRGGGPAGGDLNWAPTYYLTREAAPSNSASAFTVSPTSFWSGTLKFPKDAVTEGETIQYKFLIGYDWGRDEFQGGQPNRTFTVPVGKKDTTLQWGFFNNERPVGRANTDTVRVEFRTNLAKAISNGGFSIGDTIQVQTGFFGTTTESGRTKNMIRVAGTSYSIVDTIITSRGELLDYQYYVLRNGTGVRENYYNFTFSGPIQGEAERRQVEVPIDASLTNTMIVLDTATSITQARRQPEFPNSRPLARDVNVTYTVDLRPAFYQVLQGDILEDIQGDLDVEPSDIDSILAWGVWMNGLAVGDWSNPSGGDWGLGLRENLNKKMWDDGTNGDAVAGDTLFSRIVQVSPDSTTGTLGRVGQVFKFGIYGGDNEGGQGGFGNNHLANVVDTDSIYTLESQFGSINPAFFDAWDYDNKRPAVPTSVIDPTKPLTYELAQNYPNPFNPATKIRYSIPVQSNVILKVYNAIGQQVATLTEGVQTAGIHTVEFDARNLASGLYFYRISAGNFVSVKKMMLLK